MMGVPTWFDAWTSASFPVTVSMASIRVYPTIWKYLVNPFFSYVYLVLSHSLSCGMKLAVQVRQTYAIIIDQIERADP